MLSREYLYARHCVRDLVRILQELDLRATARGPLMIDEPTVGLLMLWTILRSERTFLLRCLEGLGVDMWGLTCAVDELLDQRKAEAEAEHESSLVIPNTPLFHDAMEHHTLAWLERAEQEARALGHPWLGTEHLLLAIVALADPAVARLLQQHAITHDRLRDVVCKALANAPAQADPPILASLVEEPPRPRSPNFWDRPAVGVARRFSMGMLLALTTTYAILLGLMRALDFPGEWIVLWTVFFTGAGLGQPILFEGKNPRAASVWFGAVLFPLEVFLLQIYWTLTSMDAPGPGDIAAFTILAIPAGAPLGYLAGCLAAGVFFLADQYTKFVEKRRGPDDTDDAPADPLGDNTEEVAQPPS